MIGLVIDAAFVIYTCWRILMTVTNMLSQIVRGILIVGAVVAGVIGLVYFGKVLLKNPDLDLMFHQAQMFASQKLNLGS